MINIGSKIKELRIKKNMTQQELANKLYVSDKTISSWESNRTEPDINILSDVAKILNCSFFSLVFDSKKNNTELELKIKSTEKEQDRVLNLIKNDSLFLTDENQEAIYYKTNYRNMNNEWLRIRKEDNNFVLNYKRKENDIVKEYNVTIDNIDNLKSIFKYFDLEEVFKVIKHRVSYLYKNKYEFSFDDVKDLGTYIEIELKKYEYDFDKELELLMNLMNELNIDINKIELKRYPELIEQNNK